MVAPHQRVTGDNEKAYMPSDSVGNVPPTNVIANETSPTISEDDLEKGESSALYDNHDPANHTGIDVDYAKQEFEGLRRRYSNMSRTTSHHSQTMSRTWSRPSRRDPTVLDEDGESQFDVERVLRGTKKQEDEEHFRPKNIGVYTPRQD